jgi:hypothetical protein
MATLYRVTVVAETTDDKGGYEGSETLFELAGGAAMVAMIAPDATRMALNGAVEPGRTLADAVFDNAVTAAGGQPILPTEQTAPTFRDAEPVKQTRNRRSKAQIAADKEAEGLGYRDAAHRTEVESMVAAAPPEAVVSSGPAQDPAGRTMAAAAPAPTEPVFNPFATQ